MSFNVIVTSSFKKHAKGIAKKHPSLKSDITMLVDSLEENPKKGISLTKNWINCLD